MPSLSDSFAIAGLRLPNRIVMAPMTRSRVDEDDALGELNAEYYVQRASAGLIVTEALVVSPTGRGYAFTPGIYTDAHVRGLRMVVDKVHAAGGRIFAQLWHVGRVGAASVLPPGEVPVGPTDEPVEDLNTFARDADGQYGTVAATPPRSITDEEIAGVIGSFVTAAQNAQRAGAEGLEILAANGYLLDQFLNAAVNRRSGRYGGATRATRCAFLLEVIDAMLECVPKMPLGVRLSPFGNFNKMPDDANTRATFLHLAREMERRKIAYVHFNDEPVSIGHLNQEAVVNTSASGSGTAWKIPKSFLREFRAAYSGPVIFCGGLNSETATKMLSNGEADLVAFGLHFIANPDLPRRLIEGLALAEPNTEFFYGGGREGYTDYPAYGAD